MLIINMFACTTNYAISLYRQMFSAVSYNDYTFFLRNQALNLLLVVQAIVKLSPVQRALHHLLYFFLLCNEHRCDDAHN